MVTLGLLSLVVVGALALLLFSLARVWTLERAFRWVAWIPLAALALEGALFRPMLAALGYLAAAIPVFTAIASVMLTVVGATLVASAGSRSERRRPLIGATLIASVPAALLSAYALYAAAQAGQAG